MGIIQTQGGVHTPYPVYADHLGTPRAVTDPIRQVDLWRWSLTGSAFGEHLPQSDPDGDGQAFTLNLRFPGQYYDAESGLHYNYFRDYDPNTGRYVESDPIGLLGGINTYGYVNSNPLNYTDQYGLFFDDGTLGKIGKGAIKGAIPAGTAAAADGPLPVGDLVGGLILFFGIVNEFCHQYDCTEITAAIKAQKEIVIERYFALLRDRWGLYGNPVQRLSKRRGSWVGHIQQFQDAQRNLRKLIDEAKSMGCPVDPDAEAWASTPPPDRPAAIP